MKYSLRSLMKFSLRDLFLVTLIVALADREAMPVTPPDDGLNELQGVWTLTSSKGDGKEVELLGDGETTLEIRGSRVVGGIRFTSGDTVETSTSTLSVTNGSPKQIDWIVLIVTEDRKTGMIRRESEIIKGLYSLTGDELTICTGCVHSVRPDSFEAKPGKTVERYHRKRIP